MNALSDNSQSLVVLRGVKDSSVERAVRDCLTLCDWESWIPRDSTVVIKPNLCAATPDKVVANTDVAVMAALCELLLTRTSRIFIGESNLLRQSAWDGFSVSGYKELAQRLGVTLVNFSEEPTVSRPCPPAGNIEVPKRLLECDAFITAPVLKTHALTYFTGSLKNQWGCVPNYHDRLIQHRLISQMLSSLHKIFRPKFSLMDGIVCMEGRGPVNGIVRRLDVVLGSRDLVALDATAMRMTGLDPRLSRPVATAAGEGLGKFEAQDIRVDGDWLKYKTQFQAPSRDWANEWVFQLTRFPWFVKIFLDNESVYEPIAKCVRFLRRAGVVGG